MTITYLKYIRFSDRVRGTKYYKALIFCAAPGRITTGRARITKRRFKQGRAATDYGRRLERRINRENEGVTHGSHT